MVIVKRALALWAAALTLLIASMANAQDLKPMSIGVYTGSFVSLPIYVGVESGIYEKHGLDVSTVDFRSAPEATAAMMSGAIDLMGNSVGNLMLVNKQGMDMVTVIEGYPTPVWVIVVNKGIATPHKGDGYPSLIVDLKGLKVGVPAIGSDGHNFMRRFASDAGLNPETDVTYVAAGLGPNALAAFKAGQLDAIIAIEPVAELLKGIGGTVLLDLALDKSVPQFESWTSSVWHTRRKHADENADAMHAFQKAHEEALEFISNPANRTATAEIWSKYNKALTQDVMISVLDRLGPLVSPYFNCQGIDNFAQFQVDNSLITPSEKQSCADLVWSGAKQYERDTAVYLR
ncbi:ABC transporter substrate-binding protein [Sinisalibacter aestuarii]|uniref:ABC transporter substrate-binding protein n=1 Tax=Sinisalibacter aestuarii TaxID=2949426 RepID=A0ABQ5LZ36_9RHOB|nr:ABC transporter substrate-binding protein [Sinisalibacter aestuarii]GKY89898.1 hypothetical protein STA1M1_37670 [Sinisalibacter aestuarii]